MKKFMKLHRLGIRISKERLRVAIYEAIGRLYTQNDLRLKILKLERKKKLYVRRKSGQPNYYRWIGGKSSI